ncbi:MAG TPA: OsmC family protein [Casimicrobiaceae bacterium]|nr:OsmC family protein [Casimicrobiaceae bacterium]
MNYTATIEWMRGDDDFQNSSYSRAHQWRFDGGAVVRGSSSPHVVPVPQSDPKAVDPEEAFVASLSSCHMLWFLAIAAKRGFVVDSYHDEAFGVMDRNEHRKLAMTEVVLRPKVLFAEGKAPSPADHEAMHEKAHDACFIAASVTTIVRVEPSIARDGAR